MCSALPVPGLFLLRMRTHAATHTETQVTQRPFCLGTRAGQTGLSPAGLPGAGLLAVSALIWGASFLCGVSSTLNGFGWSAGPFPGASLGAFCFLPKKKAEAACLVTGAGSLTGVGEPGGHAGSQSGVQGSPGHCLTRWGRHVVGVPPRVCSASSWFPPSSLSPQGSRWLGEPRAPVLKAWQPCRGKTSAHPRSSPSRS